MRAGSSFELRIGAMQQRRAVADDGRENEIRAASFLIFFASVR